jgi:hypothetical protein
MVNFILSLFRSFKTFSFKPKDNFEPSRSTKNFWLYTKKTAEDHGDLPGMFNTEGYSTQLLAFIGIFILEGFATLYGYNQGMSLGAVGGCIVADIAFAAGAHYLQKEVCELKNKNFVNFNLTDHVRINRCAGVNKVWNFAIVASAGFKCYCYYETSMNVDGYLIGVVVCYLVAALLHILYTGYFLYTTSFNYRIWKDYYKYIDSRETQNVAKKVSRLIINSNIELIEASSGRRQNIVKRLVTIEEFASAGNKTLTDKKTITGSEASLDPSATSDKKTSTDKQLIVKSEATLDQSATLDENTSTAKEVPKYYLYYFEICGILEDSELNELINKQKPVGTKDSTTKNSNTENTAAKIVAKAGVDLQRGQLSTEPETE